MAVVVRVAVAVLVRGGAGRRAAAPEPPSRCRIAARPSASTSRPETRFSQGYSCSGRMNSDSVSVTNPSANTVAVCATVTVAPSANACRAVPREPAR